MTHWPNSDTSRCQIGVIGINDGTRVDLTFPANSGRGAIEVEFEGQTYTNGDIMSVALDRYSTLQIQSKGTSAELLQIWQPIKSFHLFLRGSAIAINLRKYFFHKSTLEP